MLISTQRLPVPPVGYGGIERVAYNLAVGLNALGHDVCVVCPDGSRLPDKIIQVNTGKPSKENPEKERLSIYKDAMKNYEVVCDFSHLKYAEKTCTNTSSTYIPVCHTLDLPKFSSNKPRLVCVSKAHSRVIRERYGYESRVVYNGIDTSSYLPGSNHARQKRLLFMGRFAREKGALEAIRIAKRSGLPLDLLEGRLDEPVALGVYRAIAKISPSFALKLTKLYNGTLDLKYMALIYAEMKKSDVNYIPSMSEEDKKLLLWNDYAFIFPLQWEEPFGLTVAEAQAAGLPVIAYRRGSMPELIEDGTTGFLVEPRDEIGFINAVKRVEEIDRKQCIRHAVEKFDIMVMARQYEKIFLEALSGEAW